MFRSPLCNTTVSAHSESSVQGGTMRLSRRSILAVPPAAAAAGLLAGAPASQATDAASTKRAKSTVLSVRGGDISFTPQLEAAGIKFSDNGKVRPVEKIMAAHGANYVRLRVWNNPPAGFSDEASMLAMAQRAKRAG